MSTEEHNTPSGLVDEAELHSEGSIEDLAREVSSAPAPVTEEPVRTDVSIDDYLHGVITHPQYVKYTFPASNVEQVREVFHEDLKWNPQEETFGATQIPVEDMLDAMEHLPNQVVGGEDAQNEYWQAIQSALLATPSDRGLMGAAQRQGSAWRQGVPSEMGELHAARFNFRSNKSTGEQAIMRIAGALGLGNWYRVPLWHTGIWVTLRAPSESALIEFHDRFMGERVEAARNTYGRIFSNSRVMLTSHLLDLVFDHIVDSTLNTETSLREIISVQDINLLAWAMATLVWPNGWQLKRSIIDKEELTRTIDQRLNISRMLWTDTSLLTERQRAHMSRRSGEKMTLDQVNDYKSQFPNQGKRKINLSDLSPNEDADLAMVLRVPSIADHINSGTRWIFDIIGAFDGVAQVHGGEQARNRYVASHMAATLMRQHEHWIDSIVDGELEITDRETIAGALNQLSSLDNLRERLNEEIKRYVDDATISLVGIPTGDGSEIKQPLPRFPHLIPIDPVHTFFIQLVQKVTRIRAR